MYKSLTRQDIQRILKVESTYRVDGLIVSGTNPKAKGYRHLHEALDKLGLAYSEEKINDEFFNEIKCFIINGKRIWFDVAYGTAYLSELVHVACLLGSDANILIGSCGALQKGIVTTDTIIPTASYGNESSTRMYNRDNDSFVYESDIVLSNAIKEKIKHREKIHEGKLMTVQAMLAETKEDVDDWSEQGYVGVDMESSTIFAVSNHFNVPSAALLFAAENLVENQLVTDESFELLGTQRQSIRKENYEIAFKTILDFVN
ncbi:MAG: hypothetical protein NTY12_03710 [Candidatus Falkowbacteria bacterium]|nr:hypothetical protein [Candidatus Falkowbacteria bacterium]